MGFKRWKGFFFLRAKGLLFGCFLERRKLELIGRFWIFFSIIFCSKMEEALKIPDLSRGFFGYFSFII